MGEYRRSGEKANENQRAKERTGTEVFLEGDHSDDHYNTDNNASILERQTDGTVRIDPGRHPEYKVLHIAGAYCRRESDELEKHE